MSTVCGVRGNQRQWKLPILFWELGLGLGLGLEIDKVRFGVRLLTMVRGLGLELHVLQHECDKFRVVTTVRGLGLELLCTATCV